MSLWKFNNFETDIDFTDADFMEKFENAYECMMKNVDNTPKVGKVSEIIRSQCEVFDTFFGEVFGKDSVEKLFSGKKSIEMRVEACNSLYDFRNQEQGRYNDMVGKYRPNRQRRRQNSKRQRRK